MPLKQLCADKVFQRMHLFADRAGCDIHFLSRAGKIAMPGRDFKSADRIQGRQGLDHGPDDNIGQTG